MFYVVVFNDVNMENTIYNDENIAKYFAGELDEKKLESMENNLLNNREKEKEIKDFSRLWEKSAELAAYDKIDADADWHSVKQKMGFNRNIKRISFTGYFARIAAVLVLAVGLVYLFNQLIKEFPANTKSDYLQFSATTSAQDFILPDSTVVALNKNASLFYNSNYGTDNRDVILEGEGFFRVEKNKSLPFRVFAGNSTIEVLGTSFNIKPNDSEVVVSVITGHVAFYETTKKDNRVDLLENEQSKFDIENKVFETKSVVDQNNLAWRTHRLYFKDEQAKVAFEVVAEYFGKELVVKKDANLNWEFSGEFINWPIEEIVSFITNSSTEKYEVQITENKLIIGTQNSN